MKSKGKAPLKRRAYDHDDNLEGESGGAFWLPLVNVLRYLQ